MKGQIDALSLCVIGILFICEHVVNGKMTGKYYIDGSPEPRLSDVNAPLAYDIIQDAFDVWTCYIQIQFYRVTDPHQANIFVVFGGEEHSAFKKDGSIGDCPNTEFSNKWQTGFGVAAHATLINHRLFPANIHLHETQVWTYGKETYGGRSLLEVMVHEIGHVFGIGHLRKPPGAVMTSGYRKYSDPATFDLTRSDIQALRRTQFGKVLSQKKMIRFKCKNKPWQLKSNDRKKRTRECQDFLPRFCHSGALVGYCEQNFNTARLSCRKSCAFCKCEDRVKCTLEMCIHDSYQEQAQLNCRKTCGYCPEINIPWVKFERTAFAKKPCIDEGPQRLCNAKKGWCNDLRRNVMRKVCRKTCGFCKS